MFCQKCGQELAKDVAFCGKCGAKVGEGMIADVSPNNAATTAYRAMNGSTKKKPVHIYVGITIAVILVCALGGLKGYFEAKNDVEETVVKTVTNIFNENRYNAVKAMAQQLVRKGIHPLSLTKENFRCTKISKVRKSGDDEYTAKAYMQSPSLGKFIVDIAYEVVGDDVQVYVDLESMVFLE